MEGVPAIYLGRIVSKNNFRAFIYGADGSSKLVESWDAFEQHMQSGIWFSTIEDAKCRIKPAEIDDEEIVDEEPTGKNLNKKARK